MGLPLFGADLAIQKKFEQFFQPEALTAELAEEFLKILLTLMRVVFVVDSDYRENIKGFNGRYQFRSMDDRITMAAIFRDGLMDVKETIVDDPHITVIFRDGNALLGFLLSPKQDILTAMLNHYITTRGNLNYIYRFGYLATNLRRRLLPQP